MLQMSSEHDLFWLAAFFCQAISAVLTMAIGVFALRNAFEDVHKIAMELPTRTLPIGDSDRAKLRHEARREFLRLFFGDAYQAHSCSSRESSSFTLLLSVAYKAH